MTGDDDISTLLAVAQVEWVDALEIQRGAADILLNMFGGRPARPRLGHYRVGKALGAGASAVVYRAFDARLERSVALKVIEIEDTEHARRVTREARALARLSHPNVVEVFDTGEDGGYCYVAMELIEGQTLRGWLEPCRRSAAEVLEVFIAAGRGLAAAHARGLVHRDFKPSNVMLGPADRVRVLDFGLAKNHGPPIPAPPRLGSTPLETPAELKITQTGHICGTPPYMSPEQHTGSVSQSGDQFSFCVALCEALIGRPVYDADNLVDLLRAKRAGLPSTPPRGVPISARVWRVVRRGLHPDPARRWPTMDALVTALEAVRRRPRRTVLPALVVASVAAGVIGVAALERDEVREPCVRDSTIATVWNPDRSDAMRAALIAAWPRGGAVAADRATHELTGYLSQLRESAALGCAAEPGRPSPPDAPGPAERRACLRRALQDVDAVVSTLTASASSVAVRSDDALAWLRPIERCDRTDELGAHPPESDRVLEAERMRAALRRARLFIATGQNDAAGAQARDVLIDAMELELSPVVARAVLVRAEIAYARGDWAEASDQAREAFFIGHANRAPWVSFHAALLVSRSLQQLSRLDEAQRWVRRASTELGSGWEETAAQGQLLTETALLHMRRGDLDAAQRDASEAVQLLDQTRGRTQEATLGAVVILAAVLARNAHAHRAIELIERTLDDLEAPQRPHPSTTTGKHLCALYEVLGGAFAELERPRQSIEASRRSLALAGEYFDPGHPTFFSATNNIGIMLLQLGDTEEAETMLKEALQIGERGYGPQHPILVGTRTRLGQLLFATGRPTAALKLFRASSASLRGRPERFAVLAWVRSRLYEAEIFAQLDRSTRATDVRAEARDALATVAEAPDFDAMVREVAETLGRRTSDSAPRGDR